MAPQAPKESVMATTAPRGGRQGHAHFHPLVYQSMAGFALLLILASVAFFASAGHEAYVYVIVAGVVFGALGLPYLMRRVRRLDVRPWRGSVPPAQTGESFASFAESNFAAGRTRIPGRDAMIQALLPIAAVGVGMLLLAIAMLVATAGVPA
jgi:O-antigen/teichoic acid export membrane protein